MKKNNLLTKHEALIQDWIFFLSCFIYPVSVIYLFLHNRSITRHMPYVSYFFLTLFIIYLDPRSSAIGKEGLFGYVVSLSATLSFLLFVFSAKSELPGLRNRMILKYGRNKGSLFFIFFLEGLAFEGFTFLLVTGIWPHKGYESIWGDPSWQVYVRCTLAILLVFMSLKLVWAEKV
jgi:hypothetical protein